MFAADAFIEKTTVVVKTLDADITVITMLHLVGCKVLTSSTELLAMLSKLLGSDTLRIYYPWVEELGQKV